MGDNNMTLSSTGSCCRRRVTVALDVRDSVTKQISLRVEGAEQLQMGAEQIRIVHSDDPKYPDYDGDTSVIPGQDAQTLETENKVLKQNITVEAIPYSETTNASGGYTVTIGA